jgi:hypothetical protein
MLQIWSRSTIPRMGAKAIHGQIFGGKGMFGDDPRVGHYNR